MPSMKTITLLGEQIIIKHNKGGGKIETSGPVLEREVCPFCGEADCVYSCDCSQGAGFEGEPQEESEVADRLKVNGALDGIESMLLACATAGLIPQSEDATWNKIVQTVLDGIGNNL